MLLDQIKKLSVFNIRNSIDLVCINESWLSKDELAYVSLPGYRIVSEFCRYDKKGGGTLIFAKNELVVKPIILDNIAKLDIEISGASLKLKNGRKLNIFSIYRPPNNDVEHFFKNLEIILTKKNFKNSDFLLVGDLNIDVGKSNSVSDRLLSLMKSFGMELINKSPTRISKNTATVIDIGFSNRDLKQIEDFVIENTISDHSGLLIKFFEMPAVKQLPIYIQKRFITEEKLKLVSEDIACETWESVINENDVNEAYNKFFDIFISIINNHCPITKYKISLNRKNKSFWNAELGKLNEEVVSIWHYKDSLVKKERELFKSLSKNYNKKIRQYKIQSNEVFINKATNKTKAFWDLFHQSKKVKKRKSDDDLTKLFINGEWVSNPESIAETFSSTFVSYMNDKKIDVNKYQWTLPQNNSIFHFEPSTEDEVAETIQSLKNVKSTGLDCINIEFIKNNANLIAKPIAHIFNLSITHSLYPDKVKDIVIRPLHKKGDKSDPRNFRGINLTSNVAKIFDKLFKIRLDKFLEESNILNKNQHGFTKDQSINTAVTSLLRFIFSKIPENKIIILILSDIEKAFDTVSHDLLLQKLNKLGFCGSSNEWIASYLKDRNQVVEIEHLDDADLTKKKTKSDPCKIPSGTFQGTVLGPNFFNIYINDLFENFPPTKDFLLIGFADDTPMALADNNMPDLFEKANAKLNELNTWYGDNNLKVNIEKTNYMVINQNSVTNSKSKDSKLNSDSFSLNIDNKKLKEISECTYLGITFNNKLQFTGHIKNLIDKLNDCSFLLKVSRNEVSTKHLLTLYYAYFFSNAKFGIIFWGNAANIKKILAIQKRCIRTIYNKPPWEHCQPIFKKERILTVTNLCILEKCKFVYNNPELYKKNSDIHGYNTRHKNDVHISAKSNDQDFTDIVFFNALPDSIKSSPTAKQFDKKLKQILLDNPFYKFQDFMDFFS